MIGVKKIVHVMSMDKFLPPYIKFLKENFDVSDHRFVFIGKPDYRYGLDKSDSVDWIYGEGGLECFVNYLCDAEKIIVHGLWSSEIQLILFKKPNLLANCYWVMWGGDFYFPERQNNIKREIIKNIGHLVTIVDGEIDYVRRNYGSVGKYIRCFGYTTNLYRKHDFKSGGVNGKKILVGNSADPSNNHSIVFSKLEDYKNENIEIYAPLSYGDKSYSSDVIGRGRALFGDRFKPLLDFMEYGDYIDFLSSVSIAVFAHSRQQAFGNIISLLGMGKKVYLNKKSTLYEFFKSMGVAVFSIDDFEISDLPDDLGRSNSKLIEAFFSKEKLVTQWREIFNHKDGELTGAVRNPCARRMPFFSVVMPVYNREIYLEDAVRSVLSQGFGDFELIISDDGSTDRSLQIAESFDDPRVRVLRGRHAGGAAARNTGLTAARGEFIVWIDSDDIQEAGALAALRKAISDTPDADVFYGDLIAFDDANPAQTVRTNYPDYFNQDIVPGLLRGNMLPNPGTAVRRTLYDQYGDYDVTFRRCHDYQIWTRLAATAKFKKVNAFLCRWRQHGGSLSSTTSKFFEGRVAVDMFERYPASRLFPELSDGDSGLAALKVADMLEALQEFGPAARMMCRATASGPRDAARLKELVRKAGPDFIPSLTCLIRSDGDAEKLSRILDDLGNQTFQDFNVYVIAPYDVKIEREVSRAWPVIETVFHAGRGSDCLNTLPAGLLSGASVIWIDESVKYAGDFLEKIYTELKAGSRHSACISYVQ